MTIAHEAAGPDGLDRVAIRAAILDWYDARGRSLAFRGTKDPYAVLVSEAMAQQTQVARVGPAWTAFMATFPTVTSLAEASTGDVLRTWSNLGYNRRALNLQRAARAIVAEHGGIVPSEIAALERLPGVGPYTARAVASIAFGAPVAAVDTNVRRVVGRVAIGGEPSAAADAQAVADALVPAERPGDWTHAVMDLGATLCRPRPLCDECPVRTWCVFGRSEPRAQRPRRAGRTEPRFEATNRWLRGRIIERLRNARPGAWVTFDEAIGAHDVAAVTAALEGLAADGLLARHPTDRTRARLPVE